MKRLSDILKDLIVLSIDDNLTVEYADIDSFSRNMDPSYPKLKSPFRMGKNDLWIAATARFFNLPLLTTDGDFQHLDNHLLTLRHIPKSSLTALI